MAGPSDLPSAALDLSTLQTEGQNPLSNNIDVVSTEEICLIINEQDQLVPLAVSRCIPSISRIIDELSPRVRQGGRVIYIGAGTSGRLGILDASEIPPTYSAPYGQWIGLIAGGTRAIQYAVEGAEDSPEAGANDLLVLDPPLSPTLDSVIGLAASGRTPYVLGALAHARAAGCFTAGVCCVSPSALRDVCEVVVECLVGPEVVTGSTRMKSGTAQKLMVDVKRSNLKLFERARRLFRAVLEPLTLPPHSKVLRVDMHDDEALDSLIEACRGSVKQAIVAAFWSCEPRGAAERLDQVEGILKRALFP